MLLNKLIQTHPERIFVAEHKESEKSNYHFFSQQLLANPIGQSNMDVYSVFPGIEVSFNSFFATHIACRHTPSDTKLEICYCKRGRIGWNMKNGIATYLGTGDLSLHSRYYCADSDILFPLGFFEGISIAVDLDYLTKECPLYLKEAGINPSVLSEQFCMNKPSTILSCTELENIFAPLYDKTMMHMRQPLLKLKIQELLLYLYCMTLQKFDSSSYLSRHTQIIKKIHQQLTENLSQRFTIEKLSKQYLIDASTLKEVFKYVYGSPIATYMKEYRTKKAMKLLVETDYSIYDIASQLGYKTQSKFSKAFKDITHVSPSEYKKLNK